MTIQFFMASYTCLPNTFNYLVDLKLCDRRGTCRTLEFTQEVVGLHKFGHLQNIHKICYNVKVIICLQVLICLIQNYCFEI